MIDWKVAQICHGSEISPWGIQNSKVQPPFCRNVCEDELGWEVRLKLGFHWCD